MHQRVYNERVNLCTIESFYFPYFKIPETDDWVKIANDFYSEWNFPNCIGSLDGKHINIRCPSHSGSMNFNYKKTFSIVLMALASAKYEIIYFDVGTNGRISDGGVYNSSGLCHAIETDSLNVPQPRPLPNTNTEIPYVIVADDAFALKTYLMKPFAFRNMDHDERIFNYRLSRARRVVENVFGIMSSRFRILLKTIEINQNSVKLCVSAICALHNWLLKTSRSEYLRMEQTNIQNGQNENHEPENHDHDRNSSNAAKRIRNIFKNYFLSPEGQVSWQENMI